MRKVFRALDDDGANVTTEKLIIGDNAKTPNGWHDSVADALRVDAPKRRGRPPRVEEATEEPVEEPTEDAE